jgi:hypothetical protein
MTAYPTPPGDSAEPVAAVFTDMRRQIREGQRPSGTNLGSLVAQVQAALANINATVATAIAANSMTTAQIQNLVANPGAIAPSSVSALGGVSGATGNFPTGLTSLGARSTTLTTGFANGYIDSAGRFGVVPSSVTVKQDIVPAHMESEVTALLRMALVDYRYIASVEELGAAAPVERGSLAEYLVAIGLGRYVSRNAEGDVDGINYERLTIPLVAVVQHLDARLRALEER